jgi:hypothetical protein
MYKQEKSHITSGDLLGHSIFHFGDFMLFRNEDERQVSFGIIDSRKGDCGRKYCFTSQEHSRKVQEKYPFTRGVNIFTNTDLLSAVGRRRFFTNTDLSNAEGGREGLYQMAVDFLREECLN